MLFMFCILKSGCHKCPLSSCKILFPRPLKVLLAMMLPGLCLISLEIKSNCVCIFSWDTCSNRAEAPGQRLFLLGMFSRTLSHHTLLYKSCFCLAHLLTLSSLLFPSLCLLFPSLCRISSVTSSPCLCLVLQVRISSDTCKSSISPLVGFFSARPHESFSPSSYQITSLHLISFSFLFSSLASSIQYKHCFLLLPSQCTFVLH